MKTNITAKDIEKLLAVRHSKDLCVPQCKTGPSWGNTALFIMDFWAMNSSWNNLCFTGYEIKVDRGDFLNDKKWRSYLNYCNEFYFVCPTGLILPTELPDEAGLLYVSKTGTRLFKKKQSQTRDIPDGVYDAMTYVMICRAVIRGELAIDANGKMRGSDRSFKKKYFEDWLKNKELDWEFGRNVSKAIRQTIDEKIDSVQSENNRLEDKIKSLESVRNFCVANNIKIGPDYEDGWNKHRLDRLLSGIPENFENDLSRAIEYLEKVKDNFDSMGVK